MMMTATFGFAAPSVGPAASFSLRTWSLKKRRADPPLQHLFRRSERSRMKERSSEERSDYDTSHSQPFTWASKFILGVLESKRVNTLE